VVETQPINRKHRSTAAGFEYGRGSGDDTAQPLLVTSRGAVERAARTSAARRMDMLETIAIILIVLWLLGMVSGYTLGNFIYVLLVIAIVLFLVRLISGRRV
jgi:hypothetical protein